MSMFSIASSNGTSGLRDRRLERIEVHRDEVDRHDRRAAPCAAVCSGWSRRARRPPCTSGVERLDPAVEHLGEAGDLVDRDAPATPRLRSAAAVPPVETISQPSATRPWANAHDPALVADRDQCARHAERSPRAHEGSSTGSGAGRAGPPRPRPAPTAGSRRCSTASTRAASVSGGVARRTGTRRLRQDRPAVVHLVHQVHGGAAHRRARRQHRLVHPAPVHARARRTRAAGPGGC